MGDDDLVYPVAGLLGEPPGERRRYHVGPVVVDAGEDISLALPVEGDLHLARTNRGLLVRATLTTALSMTCSRCLRPVEVPLRLEIDEEALPSLDLESGQPLDTAAEPEVLRLSDHHELDLEPLVRDAIQLLEPIAPLCRPDCPGLCPVCGADLAAGGHAPHDDEPDPRLEALRTFQVDGETETD